MIQIPFLLTELLFAAVWLMLRLIVWSRMKTIDWKREALLLLMYVNLAVILRFVFFPMALRDGRIQPLLFEPDRILSPRVNLIPLVGLLPIRSSRGYLLNVVGNVTMFIPSGIVLPVVYQRLDRLWKVTAAGAGISLAIELVQLPFAVRTTDVDDLLLNTLGVMLGYGIYVGVRRLCGKRGEPKGA